MVHVNNTGTQTHSIPGNNVHSIGPGLNLIPADAWDAAKVTTMIKAHLDNGTFIVTKATAAENKAEAQAEKDAAKLLADQEKAEAKRVSDEKHANEKRLAYEHDVKAAADKAADAKAAAELKAAEKAAHDKAHEDKHRGSHR